MIRKYDEERVWIEVSYHFLWNTPLIQYTWKLYGIDHVQFVCLTTPGRNKRSSFLLDKMHIHLFYGTEKTKEYAFLFAWWNPEPWFSFAFDTYGIILEGESLKAKCTFTKLRFFFPLLNLLIPVLPNFIDGGTSLTRCSLAPWEESDGWFLKGRRCEFVRELFSKGMTWKLWGEPLGRWRLE